MTANRVNSLVQWWVTPKLPPEDILAKHNPVSKWITHPVKRRLARARLAHLRKDGKIKVIGITGSTGKTTTTEILASILSLDGPTVRSALGIDPVYNIPNTILKANTITKYLILEMSVEYKNEMDYYLWLSSPDVGIITNINKTHTEFLNDEMGVVAEKGKLIKHLPSDGFAVLNYEDRFLKTLDKETRAQTVFFGNGGSVFASNIKVNKDMSTNFILNMGKSEKSVRMHALGRQFVYNALAAAAAAYSLGVDFRTIVRGIEKFTPPKHRLNVFISKKYGLIFDDTYNSNPKAAEESLDTFGLVSGNRNKIAVIGDMLELGKLEENSHRELGKKAGSMGFSLIVGVGDAARFIVEEASKKSKKGKCYLAGDYNEALEIVLPHLSKSSALFVKGSRSVHLEKLIEKLI